MAGKLPPSGSWSGNWGYNKVPYGKHHSGRDRKPPNKGCGGKKRTFCFFLVVMSAAAGTVAQTVNVIRTLV